MIKKPTELAKPVDRGETVYRSQEDHLLNLLRCGFSLGAVYGFTVAKQKKLKTLKELTAWLETPEAKALITGIVKGANP